jgi:hypothetical protein
MPSNPLQLVAFILVLGLLLAFVQIGILTVAFEKLSEEITLPRFRLAR